MKKNKFKTFIFQFLLILSGLVGVVMLWRGVWGILDIYLFPDNKFISYVFSIFIGFIILLVDDFELGEIVMPRNLKKLVKDIENEDKNKN